MYRLYNVGALLIKKTAESTETVQKWDTFEHFKIHRELKDPKWKLSWPIDPGTVDVADIPPIKPGPLKFE